MHQFPILTLAFLALTLATNPAAAQPPTKPSYFMEVCRSAYGNYTRNSTYHNNLQTVLSDLKHRANSSPFDNLSFGELHDKVYGQYYCRGDLDVLLCVDCVRQAAESVLRNCSGWRAAVMWYQECTVRYGNESMEGLEAEYPRSWWASDQNVLDPDSFSGVLQETVDWLIEDTTRFNVGSVWFGTKEARLAPSSNSMLYCLVQCSPDLNGTQCATCLQSAFDFMPSCCGNSSTWMSVFYPVCQVRYSTLSQFYALPPPPPQPLP